MSDIIIVGGGVSGLAAAFELEKQGISYTLIEVKSRTGGHITTTQQNGFVMDGGTFAFARPDNWPLLDDLGLEDALFHMESPANRPLSAFRDGTQTLVDSLAARLTGRIIQRMAVTSLGITEDETGYNVCLENGLAMQAKGVIVAIPARYASRLFWTLQPDVATTLENYHYDEVTRVALGYTTENKPQKAPQSPPSVLFSALISTDHPSRVPQGGLLVQAAIRVPLSNTTPEKLVDSICTSMNWNQPDEILVREWGEADPLTITAAPPALLRINDLLPAGIQVAGGCYQFLPLPQRTESARATARKVLAAVNA
ncbi:MAG: FAD-dependent oxidoreductase [Chloroflexota bacterium]